jgi:DNA-binding CsgD family transcriptional regulator
MDDKIGRDLLDLYVDAQNYGVEEFCDESLKKIKKYLPFDSAIIAEGHKTGQLAVAASVHLYNQPIEKWWDYQNIRNIDPAAHKATSNPGAIITYDSAYAPRGKEFSFFRDYLKTYEVSHALLTFTVSKVNFKNSHKLRAISLWRASGKNPYSPQEEHLASNLFDHVLRARELNQHTVLSSQSPDNLVRTLICTRAGHVLVCDTTVSLLLREEWPGWEPPLLPTKLLKSIFSSKTLSYQGHSLGVMARPLGKNFVVSLRPHISIAGLTPAESNVARLAAIPISYKEIATRLDLSESTIRNQLHSVYQKLGLKGKAELTAIFTRKN